VTTHISQTDTPDNHIGNIFETYQPALFLVITSAESSEIGEFKNLLTLLCKQHYFFTSSNLFSCFFWQPLVVGTCQFSLRREL
jgi:hypothetical protein